MARSYASTVIAAPADEVWARIRDFNGLSVWHGGMVAESEIEEGSFVGWWTTFDCDRDQIDHWEGLFANEVFQGGFDALKAHFAA